MEYDSKQSNSKAIVFDYNDIGQLKRHSTEGLKHYIAKAILMFHLQKLKHRVVSEVRIDGVGKLDLYDIDVKVIYEIESTNNRLKTKKKYHQKGVDVIIIPILKIGNDIAEMEKYIKEFIRPD